MTTFLWIAGGVVLVFALVIAAVIWALRDLDEDYDDYDEWGV